MVNYHANVPIGKIEKIIKNDNYFQQCSLKLKMVVIGAVHKLENGKCLHCPIFTKQHIGMYLKKPSS